MLQRNLNIDTPLTSSISFKLSPVNVFNIETHKLDLTKSGRSKS